MPNGSHGPRLVSGTGITARQERAGGTDCHHPCDATLPASPGPTRVNPRRKGSIRIGSPRRDARNGLRQTHGAAGPIWLTPQQSTADLCPYGQTRAPRQANRPLLEENVGVMSIVGDETPQLTEQANVRYGDLCSSRPSDRLFDWPCGPWLQPIRLYARIVGVDQRHGTAEKSSDE
jgi:hypothetical protein